MACTVHYYGGKTKSVKNLGWLQRRKSKVVIDAAGILDVRKYDIGIEATLWIDFADRVLFLADFQSLEICQDWAQRYLVANGYVEEVWTNTWDEWYGPDNPPAQADLTGYIHGSGTKLEA